VQTVSSREIRQNRCRSVSNRQDFTEFYADFTQAPVAKDRPRWLAELSTGIKRHRQGRTGWTVEVM
jgi:hypothetical protein